MQLLHSKLFTTCRIIRLSFLAFVFLGAIYFVSILTYRRQARNLTQSPAIRHNTIASRNYSRWAPNKLVIIPAVWKEINWANRSSWPHWLQEGLHLNLNSSSLYDVYLYQRIDPDARPPYDWPYCPNGREESGVYLQFIRDFYYDLPKKMLFIHGNPFLHSKDAIEKALCIHDDVHFVHINDAWIQNRTWIMWPRDPTDNISMGYKCAAHILNLFHYDAEFILNPSNHTPKDESVVSTFCCAQFYVTKQRIHRYKYRIWSALYNLSRQSFCSTPIDREIVGEPVIKFFGGSLEHLWHVILGLQPINSRIEPNNCFLFRPSCSKSSCQMPAIDILNTSMTLGSNG